MTTLPPVGWKGIYRMKRDYRWMRCEYCGARLDQVDILTARERHHRYEVHLLCWSCKSICSLSYPILDRKAREDDAEGGDQEVAA